MSLRQLLPQRDTLRSRASTKVQESFWKFTLPRNMGHVTRVPITVRWVTSQGIGSEDRQIFFVITVLDID